MARRPPFIPPLISLFVFIIIIIICIINVANTTVVADSFTNRLRNDTAAILKGSIDYGNMIHNSPSNVLYPSSVDDIIDLIKSSNTHPDGSFSISAMGGGHSIRGQAMSTNGVVVDMTALNKNNNNRIQIGGNSWLGFYADVGGEQMWIDVLKFTLKQGLAPIAWTDYLHLTVGGTLSNAGISGQSCFHGPQISKVLELDVITGKGEFITCSPNQNEMLFFSVLGGLGQFGIIIRARIVLDKAPIRAKRLILVYSNFSSFTSDQESLISSDAPDYVEGFLITNEDVLRKLNPSISSLPRPHPIDIFELLKKQGILYSIELVKYYDSQTTTTIDHDIGTLINKLNFIPGYVSSEDVSFFDFIYRVGYLEYPHGPSYNITHPWMVLLIPKSSIHDFHDNVLSIVLPKFNETSPLFIMYPLNRSKWDDRMSVVIPNEDVFYMVSLLHSVGFDKYQVIDYLNDEILTRCNTAGIKSKLYLPHFNTELEWIEHFGNKLSTILTSKLMFDPKMILSPGQGIFN